MRPWLRQPVRPGSTPAAVGLDVDAAFANALEYARGFADAAAPCTAARCGVDGLGDAPVFIVGNLSVGIFGAFGCDSFNGFAFGIACVLNEATGRPWV